MPQLDRVNGSALRTAEAELKKTYKQYQSEALSLDMTRGKPCTEQLDLSVELITALGPNDFRSKGGVDARNYGGLDGLPEAKELFASFLEVGTDEIIIGGNSSLQLMHQVVSLAMSHGVAASEGNWQAGGTPKFVCPVPGYDRHFSVCEHLGIEMIPVGMNDEGPDMDAVEALVANDPQIKGLWMVPKHGNPSGITLSDSVVQRFAQMKTAASDFRLLWDNAYTVHHLTESPPALTDILKACKQAGNPDRVLLFGSTSKISFAGAGIAMVGGSVNNMNWLRGHLSKMTIGPDKLNQLRHVKFFKNLAGIQAHMKKHAAILQPKFETVNGILQEQLGSLNVASWNVPQGGYFINFDSVDGCATRIVALAKQAGVKLTAAGSSFPYGKDPQDRNIRLAPTLPPSDELVKAMNIFATCVKLATLEKLAS